MEHWRNRFVLVLCILSVAVGGSNSEIATSDATTKAPTTTTTQSTSTTTQPSTSTTTTTTTTTQPPTPTPEFPKNENTWFVNDTDLSCLVFSAALQIRDTSTQNLTKYDIPKDANFSESKCNVNSAELILSFPVPNSPHDQVYLNLTFSKLGTEYGLSNATATISMGNSTTIMVPVVNETLFLTPVNRSYKCNKVPVVKLTNGELRVSNMQFEAFRQTKFDHFGKELECSYDDVSAVVPFAVGASLALLVVIVLIAYLIGRRRSRARGYQSVYHRMFY